MKRIACGKPLLFMIVCMLLASATGCSMFPKEEATLATPALLSSQVTYDKATVKKGDIEVDQCGAGMLVSASQKDYFFQYSGGVISSVRVKTGDQVKKGEPLATLYTDDLNNQIEMQLLSVRQAQLAVDNAAADLADDQSASPNDKKLLRNDNSALQNARFSLERENLTLKQLQTQKSRMTVCADIDGQVVYAADISAGSNVAAYQTLFTIADPTKMQIDYGGSGMDSFKLGAKVNITYNGSAYTGHVTFNGIPTSTSSDSSPEARKVLIRFDTLPKDASIGDSASVKLLMNRKENVLLLDSSYIKQGSDEYANYVTMLDKNGLRIKRAVEVGLASQSQTEIVKGLSEGDTVIQ